MKLVRQTEVCRTEPVISLSLQQRRAGALADYTRVIELNPAEAVADYNRALVWRAQGAWARAMPDDNEASALNPRFAEADCKRELVRLWQSAALALLLQQLRPVLHHC